MGFKKKVNNKESLIIHPYRNQYISSNICFNDFFIEIHQQTSEENIFNFKNKSLLTVIESSCHGCEIMTDPLNLKMDKKLISDYPN